MADDPSIRALLVRELGNVYVGAVGSDRGPLREKLSVSDLEAIAERALAGLPKEVLIACGGCGGEPIAAGFREDGFGQLVGDVASFFGLDPDDQEYSFWARVDAVPLIIKGQR